MASNFVVPLEWSKARLKNNNNNKLTFAGLFEAFLIVPVVHGRWWHGPYWRGSRGHYRSRHHWGSVSAFLASLDALQDGKYVLGEHL
jgi:hypothetical protein